MATKTLGELLAETYRDVYGKTQSYMNVIANLTDNMRKTVAEKTGIAFNGVKDFSVKVSGSLAFREPIAQH